MDRSGLRGALLLVELASRLVPRTFREDWSREWQAELIGRRDELRERGRLTWSARMDLMMRAAGAINDARTYGRERGTMMRGAVEEIRIAARALRRRPGFVVVVAGTLAVGVGATTTLFGVARDVLLRPFPYPDPERVVAVEGFSVDRAGFNGNVTYPNLYDLEASTSAFEAIAGTRWWQPAHEDEQGSIVVRGATVTANFFRVLGVEPGLGRFFAPDEEGEGRENLVVLSHAFWTDRFGADPAIVGRDIRLTGATYRVIGVTSADFEDPWLMDGPGAEPQLWRTVWSPPSEWPRSGRSWKGLARIRDGVSLAAAQDEVDAAFAALVEAYPDDNANRVMRLTPLRERVAGPSRPVLFTLLGSVGLLLLIACGNLANLMLARALDRQQEFAIHRALGASGGRILARSLWEALLLAVLGGALGIGLAAWAGGGVRSLGALLPRPVTGSLDPAVLGFALVVTVGCGLFFGVLPAIHGLRTHGTVPGRDGGRGSTSGRDGQRLRRTLVVGQLALTVGLLVGAGLLARSFQRLGAVDLGLTTAGVSGVELHGSAWYDLEPAEAQAQWDEVLTAVRAVPGVQAAGAIDYMPLAGSYSCDGVQRDDLPEPGPGEGQCAEVRVVLPGAHTTLGIDLVRGRVIDEADGLDGVPVAVIDESTARAFWPAEGEDPIGARIRVHGQTHEVVGIVRDMQHFGPGEDQRPMLYLAAPQEGWNGIARGLALIVRFEGGGSVGPALRGAVHGVNASIALGDLQPLDELLASNLAAPRFRTALMLAFSATALFLALLGIAGVMMRSVTRRHREMGVRLALGADPAQVSRMVMREGSALIAGGIVVGLVGALALSGLLDSLLFQVTARDPLVYGAVTLVLGGAAAVACYLPARRASRVDPVTALHAE